MASQWGTHTSCLCITQWCWVYFLILVLPAWFLHFTLHSPLCNKQPMGWWYLGTGRVCCPQIAFHPGLPRPAEILAWLWIGYHIGVCKVYFSVFLSVFLASVLLFACLRACSAVSNSLWPHGLFCPEDFPGKNTGVGCHLLLQGIFLTQGSNSCLLHLLTSPISCIGRWILYHCTTWGAWYSSLGRAFPHFYFFKYSQFPLFVVVRFCGVASNPEPSLLEEI